MPIIRCRFCKSRMYRASNNNSLPNPVSVDLLGTTDLERAKTEIALHDTITDKTIYGIDAMIHIISHAHPILNRLLRSFLVFSILKFFYKFITYNRRVLYPCQETETDRKCIPAAHHGFRILFVISSLVLVIGMASPLSTLLNLLPIQWFFIVSLISTILFMLGLLHKTLNQRMDLWGNIATIGIKS